MAKQIFRPNDFVNQTGAFIIMILVAVILLFVGHRTTVMDPVTNKIRDYTLNIHGLIHDTNEYFINGYIMINETNKLVSKLKTLEKKFTQLDSQYQLSVPQLQKENKQLRDVLNLPDTQSEGVVVGEYVRNNKAAANQRATINAGSASLVRSSQPVVSTEGLVGLIEEVYPEYSLVLPITHPEHSMSVQLTRATAKYIARGTGDALIIENISYKTSISPGDEVIATGLGGIYPQFYPIGKVSKIDPVADGKRNIYIQPHTDFTDLRFVIVIYQHRHSLHSPN